ncbi:hypothetical protein GOBAR_AA40179 [Gossypium barbadense]|uniref:Uncharacterized protein n=1 Tax=Gossypium barbadense TaxID=3634 RepID=A0A2P5VNW8_GOSBA|nr:hypothetical protein GOBAR_AA40179 [Gossypium barbadense]
MDEGLKRAAGSGNIDALYALIPDDGNVFKHIDGMEFIDTHLHIAVVTGNTGCAMEIMNLKPSFARKLNQDGFSPIHLALLNGKPEMREGFIVVHYSARDVNVHLLSRVLNTCPDCIFDLNVMRQTALHIAVESNNFESAFKDNKPKRSKVLNFQDKNGNTVLHLATSTNHPQVTLSTIYLLQYW